MEEFRLPHHHGDRQQAERLHDQLSKTRDFATAADRFHQLGDTTRIRIFWLLSHREECVINLAAMLNMSSPAVSHHLRPMRDCGLIVSRRDGKEVYYKTADTTENELLYRMVEQFMAVAKNTVGASSHIPQEEIAHRLHEFLVEHLSERITIEELAKRFLMNTTGLKQAFKAVYGNSIAAHINEHRMMQAATQLIQTRDSVAEIAKSVGYESQSRFSVSFKKQFSMLPTEYRKTHGKHEEQVPSPCLHPSNE